MPVEQSREVSEIDPLVERSRDVIADLTAALDAAADPARARQLETYFQVRPGGYGEGDRFLGVTMGELRKIVRRWRSEPFEVAPWLGHLRHEVHEHRMAALMVMGERAARGDDSERDLVAATYLEHTDRVNNWDLVDESSRRILGVWLEDRDRSLLDGLAVSSSVWERRIAMVTTFHFLCQGESADTYRIAELLLGDEHDLIHKATGWMLREAGKRVDVAELRSWLGRFAPRMPRTALRYAIEHFDAEERRRWLAMPRVR